MVRCGIAKQARPGVVWKGYAEQGYAEQARLCEVLLGAAELGMACNSEQAEPG